MRVWAWMMRCLQKINNVFFSTHVYIDDAKIVAACIEEMQEHESEVIHRYMHPNKGSCLYAPFRKKNFGLSQLD